VEYLGESIGPDRAKTYRLEIRKIIEQELAADTPIKTDADRQRVILRVMEMLAKQSLLRQGHPANDLVQ
jgi:hypothetical protein